MYFTDGTYVECISDTNSTSSINSTNITSCSSNKLTQPSIVVGTGASPGGVAESIAQSALGIAPLLLTKPSPTASPTPAPKTISNWTKLPEPLPKPTTGTCKLSMCLDSPYLMQNTL